MIERKCCVCGKLKPSSQIFKVDGRDCCKYCEQYKRRKAREKFYGRKD